MRARRQLDGPAWVTSVETAGQALELRAPERSGAPYRRAKVLVRSGGRPIRFVELPVGIDGTIRLEGPAVDPSESNDADLPAYEGLVSIVVCTRDRGEILDPCLRSIARLDDDDFEVLVVDNSASGSARTAFEHAVGEDERFKLVAEVAPGLSRARNFGLFRARGGIVAYTDDDVRVDPGWLRGLRAGFSSAAVGCVTGLVLPAELEDAVQEQFEDKVSWSSSFVRREYDVATKNPGGAFPFDAGRFGTGASFAVRASVMRSLAGFDVALGAGSPCRGGEDLDAFVRILVAGHELVYEPRAIVWHVHRGSRRDLERQVYGYGLGLTAYLTKLLVGPLRGAVLRRAARGVGVFLDDKQGEHKSGLPLGLLLRELAGGVAGPFVYLRARRAAGASWEPQPAIGMPGRVTC